jgi:hypothetical protein
METYKVNLEAYTEEQLLAQVRDEYKRLKRRRRDGVKLSRLLYRLLKNWSYVIYLCMALFSIAKFELWSWQFWLTYLPTVALVAWYKSGEGKSV